MDNVGLKNARCVRRILARAKRRSRAFSKVSPSAFLSPFVVELVCAFYFARDSSSSESLLAWRYTTPVMPTFCLREGECSSRGGGERTERMALFRLSKSVSKNYTVSFACSCFAFFAFFFESFLVFCARLRVGYFWFYHTSDQKTSTLLTKVSPHNLASPSHHHRDIKRTREELFNFSERERV